MLKRWAGFIRFLDDEDLPLEQRRRTGAARRRRRPAQLAVRGFRGGERAAAIYTLIASAKLNDIDPQAWLEDVLRRIADHPVASSPDSCPGTGKPRPSPRQQPVGAGGGRRGWRALRSREAGLGEDEDGRQGGAGSDEERPGEAGSDGGHGAPDREEQAPKKPLPPGLTDMTMPAADLTSLGLAVLIQAPFAFRLGFVVRDEPG